MDIWFHSHLFISCSPCKSKTITASFISQPLIPTMSSHISPSTRGSMPSGVTFRDQLHPTMGSLRSGFQPSQRDIREETEGQASIAGSASLRGSTMATVSSRRPRSVATIDSLRSGDRVTPVAGIKGKRPQAIQIAPNRRHASSNYHYYPEIFQSYGISKEDWGLFTAQFVNANLPTRNELIALGSLTLTMQALFLFALGPVGFPIIAMGSAIFLEGPVLFKTKAHRLKRNVRNGKIPEWLAAWNLQYFNPKGLMVGFNLPGRKIKHAAVAPRARKHTALIGTYKKPITRKKAARKARLVVVKLHDPVPEAGTVPKLDPIKIAALWRSKWRVQLWVSLPVSILTRHAVLRHPKSPFMLSSKLQSKIEAQKREIERVRRQRAELPMNGLDGTHEELRCEKKWLQEWREQAAFETELPPDGSKPSKVSWRERIRQKKSNSSLDGTTSVPAKLRGRSRWSRSSKQKKSNARMLGGSRIGDASMDML